jgi:hypothetical protein
MVDDASPVPWRRDLRRCAVHPARPAADACPHCGRPRCAADQLPGGRCSACAGPAPAEADLERAVRGGLAALATCFLAGWISTQYVGTPVFGLAVPAIAGLGCAAAAAAAGARGAVALAEAATAALLATALGDTLVPGGGSVLHPVGSVGPPYLAALAGVAAYAVVVRSPRRRQDSGTST